MPILKIDISEFVLDFDFLLREKRELADTVSAHTLSRKPAPVPVLNAAYANAILTLSPGSLKELYWNSIGTLLELYWNSNRTLGARSLELT